MTHSSMTPFLLFVTPTKKSVIKTKGFAVWLSCFSDFVSAVLVALMTF